MYKTKVIGTCAKCKEGTVQYISNQTSTSSMRHCATCKANTYKGDSVVTLEELASFNN